MITSLFFYYFYYYFFFFFLDYNSSSIFYFLFEIFRYFFSSSSFTLKTFNPELLFDYLMSLPPKATLMNIIGKYTPNVISFRTNDYTFEAKDEAVVSIANMFNYILQHFTIFFNYVDLWNYLILNPFLLFYSLVFIRTLIFSFIFLHPFFLGTFSAGRYFLNYKVLASYKIWATPNLKNEFVFNLLPQKLYYYFYIDYSFNHIMKIKRKFLKRLSMLKNDHHLFFEWGISDLFCSDFFFSFNFYYFVH